MRRTVPHLTWVLLLVPALASADGMDITWSPSDAIGCWSENPKSVESFACDTNTGENVAVVSFMLDQDMPNFVGLQVTLDLRSGSGALPDWWQFVNTGACRSTSLSVSQDFTSAKLTACQDAWGSTVLTCPPWCAPPPFVVRYLTANTLPPPPGYPFYHARLQAAFVFPSGDSNPLQAGVEYDALQIHIRHDHTIGTGACTGCSTPMALVLQAVVVADNVTLTTLGSPLHNNVIYWQSEVPLATQNVTWGRIQSLYR